MSVLLFQGSLTDLSVFNTTIAKLGFRWRTESWLFVNCKASLTIQRCRNWQRKTASTVKLVSIFRQCFLFLCQKKQWMKKGCTLGKFVEYGNVSLPRGFFLFSHSNEMISRWNDTIIISIERPMKRGEKFQAAAIFFRSWRTWRNYLVLSTTTDTWGICWN